MIYDDILQKFLGKQVNLSGGWGVDVESGTESEVSIRKGVLKFEPDSSCYRVKMGIGVDLHFQASVVQSVTVRDNLLTIEL